MINWIGVKAIICLVGAIIFAKEFYLFTHFLIALYKSGNTLKTNEKIIPTTTFMTIWFLGFYALIELWLSWVKIVVRLVYDY